jgi:hypothetical protein
MANYWNDSAKSDGFAPNLIRAPRISDFFWHGDCSIVFMAKKMNTLQVAQAARAEVEIARLRQAPPAALYLMQPQLQKDFPVKRRLQITIDGESDDQLPQSVKIIHAG